MPINITVPFERLADEIEQEVDRKYRAFWLVLFNNVNILSPILTGRYRSSHCMSIGQPSASITGTGFVSSPPHRRLRNCSLSMLYSLTSSPPHRRLRKQQQWCRILSSTSPPHRRLRNVFQISSLLISPSPPHRRLRKFETKSEYTNNPSPPHRRLRNYSDTKAKPSLIFTVTQAAQKTIHFVENSFLFIHRHIGGLENY